MLQTEISVNHHRHKLRFESLEHSTLRKAASHNTLLTPVEQQKQPLLKIETTNNLTVKDVHDGPTSVWNIRKHKKSASTSSFVYEEKKTKQIPPWDIDTCSSSVASKSYRLFVKDALIRAAPGWDLQILQELGFDPYAEEVENALVNACHREHSDLINILLTRSDDILTEEDTNVFAFCIVAYCDRGDVLEKLLDKWTLKLRLTNLKFKNRSASIIHLLSHVGCLASLRVLLESETFKLLSNSFDSSGWSPLHYSVAEGHVNVTKFLLEKGVDANAKGPYSVTPLHVAAYKHHRDIMTLLLEFKADSGNLVTLKNPAFSQEKSRNNDLPDVVQYNSRRYSTLLHWAVVFGNNQLINKMLRSGSKSFALDIEGRTPLGLALTDGRIQTVRCFTERGIRLSDGDKNWRRIKDEENGNEVIQILESTKLDSLDCSSKDGFTLLHLAASKGYLSMIISLISKGVNPNLETTKGETPIFYAIENNHQACLHQLIKICDIFHLNDKKSSILHVAAKYNNFSAIDVVLNLIGPKDEEFINLTDETGYTAIFYAVGESRFDIVQRFVHFCICKSMHIKATEDETLLQFYTERNILGQYDNAIVRVLELEKQLHRDKFVAEKCLRKQLGTTLASTKAREQLQAMYEPLRIQTHCWNFWIVISCFLMPSLLYYLDVYTDVVLAVEYYNDMKNNITNNSSNYLNNSITFPLFLTESQSANNFLLTVFFILFPTSLLSIWTLYVHLTQPDILPIFGKMPTYQRCIFYLFLLIPPIGPMTCYIENTYAQIKYINETTKTSMYPALSLLSVEEGTLPKNSVKKKGKEKEKEELRDHYNLRHLAQMRVAISNVLEATLESAFQLVLQLYIVGTQYRALKNLHLTDLTLGSIFSLTPTEVSESTRLSKQVLSVIISLVSLTWSFTSYHRFSKLGGLKILCSLPLLFAFFFQIISRAIACTVFTISYTWRIFVVLGIHFVLVLILKTFFEKRSRVSSSGFLSSSRCYSNLRPYFYVILGAFTSTLVYFRIVRPQNEKKEVSERHPTFLVQTLFLILAFTENSLLIAIGTAGLDPDGYDRIFKIVSVVLCLISFIIGVILQYVYYGCFGHPWVNINGPSFSRDPTTRDILVTVHSDDGQNRWVVKSCFDCQRDSFRETDNVYVPSKVINKYAFSNGTKKT